MEALEVLNKAFDEAQDELVKAEMSLVEASARAEHARTEQARLAAAVAALNGEPPPAASEASPPTPERKDAADLSPEEFNAERRKRQRKKRQEEKANNPYAHLECSGCGEMGTMSDTIMTAPSGAPVRMMTCGSCGNQLIT